MAFWHFKISPDAEGESIDADEAEDTVEEKAEQAKKKMRATTVELNASILRLAEVAEN